METNINSAEAIHKEYMDYLALEKRNKLTSVINEYSGYSHPLLFMLADVLTEVKSLKEEIKQLKTVNVTLTEKTK